MNPLTQSEYQYVIVGAGIAGLHCALRLKHKYPKSRILIAELYNYVGGRIVTYSPKDFNVHWESGAGRIHESHKLIGGYVKKYKLTKIPISSKKNWIDSAKVNLDSESDSWDSLYSLIKSAVSTLSKTVLATHTLHDILVSTYGLEKTKAILSHFPYTSEMTVQRADISLDALSNELGSPSFYAIKEGISAIPYDMKAELEDLGVEFLFNHRLTSIVPDKTPIHLQFDGKNTITADKVILTLHVDALKSVSPFQNLPALKYIQMSPLLRTYGVFPLPSWFSGLPKIITDSPLRYVIPINESKGLIMTSYTDGKDTKKWMNLPNKEICKEVMKETRKLFPTRTIPDPLFFKAHPWKSACSYWAPGLYDPNEISESIMNPMPKKWPNVYVCGESYSMQQTWIEGALVHANAMLKKYHGC